MTLSPHAQTLRALFDSMEGQPIPNEELYGDDPQAKESTLAALSELESIPGIPVCVPIDRLTEDDL